FFFHAEYGIRYRNVTGVQTCALPIFQPGLAEDWSLSNDRRTYTFDLREGVKFSNGADLTSEDVKFSYERVQDEWKNELKSKMDKIGRASCRERVQKKVASRWL